MKAFQYELAQFCNVFFILVICTISLCSCFSLIHNSFVLTTIFADWKLVILPKKKCYMAWLMLFEDMRIKMHCCIMLFASVPEYSVCQGSLFMPCSKAKQIKSDKPRRKATWCLHFMIMGICLCDQCNQGCDCRAYWHVLLYSQMFLFDCGLFMQQIIINLS